MFNLFMSLMAIVCLVAVVFVGVISACYLTKQENDRDNRRKDIETAIRNSKSYHTHKERKK